MSPMKFYVEHMHSTSPKRIGSGSSGVISSHLKYPVFSFNGDSFHINIISLFGGGRDMAHSNFNLQFFLDT